MTEAELIQFRQQIRKGERNLTQLKEEIYEDARILMNPLRKYIDENNLCDVKYESVFFKCVWSVEQSGSNLNLRYNCMSGKHAYQGYVAPRQYIPEAIIETLHDALNAFVGGILKTFPQLRQDLVWHINASKRNI